MPFRLDADDALVWGRHGYVRVPREKWDAMDEDGRKVFVALVELADKKGRVLIADEQGFGEEDA